MGKGVVFVLSGFVLLVCGVISDCSGASRVTRAPATHTTRL